MRALTTAAVLATSLLGYGCTSLLQTMGLADTQTNKELKRIAKHFKSDPTVETTLCLNDGATRGIIYIREFHRADELMFLFNLEEELPVYLKQLNTAQKSVYGVLTDLSEMGYTTVHSEASIPEQTKEDKELSYNAYLPYYALNGMIGTNVPTPDVMPLFNYATVLSFYKNNPHVPPGIRQHQLSHYRQHAYEFIESYAHELSQDSLWNKEQFQYAPGATLLLEREGKITIKPAATIESFVNSFYLARVQQYTPIGNLPNPGTFDIREDIALDFVSKNEQPISIITYGGSHSWTSNANCPALDDSDRISYWDNIALWNERYPEMSYSVIEITTAEFKNAINLRKAEYPSEQEIQRAANTYESMLPNLNIPEGLKYILRSGLEWRKKYVPHIEMKPDSSLQKVTVHAHSK